MPHSTLPPGSGRPDRRPRPPVVPAENAAGHSGLKDAWRRAQRGWPASFPVAQAPNAPLVVGLAGWLAGELADGSVEPYARALFYVGISAWAWGELTGGVNWFRRSLGAAGLVYVVVEAGATLST